MSDISLSAAMRQSLLNLQLLRKAADKNDQRLASGKKVSEVLDDPVNFYRSKGSYDLADSMQNYKDGIDQGISTLKATVNGLDKYKDILQQVKGLAEQAKNASVAQQAVLQNNAVNLLKAAKDLLYDTSLNGTNLVYQGQNGINFDGIDDYVQINADGSGGGIFNPDTSATVAASVKTTAGIGSYFLGLASNYNWTISNTGQLQLDVGAFHMNGTTKINDGNWHRIVVVHDATATTYSIYVDGNLDATSAPGAPPMSNGVGPRYLGGSTTSSLFAGSMDDAQVWGATAAGQPGAAWSAADVAYDYTTGTTPDARVGTSLASNQLRAHYDFSEGSGTTTTNTGAASPGAKAITGIASGTEQSRFWSGTTSTQQQFPNFLTVQLSNANSYTVQGRNMTPNALGVTIGFAAANVNSSIASIDSAIAQVDAQAASFANSFSFLQTRLNYTGTYVNTLQEAGDKLTLADLNEEAANSLAIKTRQNLSIQSMSLASESEQSILTLFLNS